MSSKELAPNLTNVYYISSCSVGLPSDSVVKNPPAMQKSQEMLSQSLGQEDPLEEGMATHSSILPWRILWTEELAGYSS